MLVAESLELTAIKDDVAFRPDGCGTRWICESRPSHREKQLGSSCTCDMECKVTVLITTLYARAHLLLADITVLKTTGSANEVEHSRGGCDILAST